MRERRGRCQVGGAGGYEEEVHDAVDGDRVSAGSGAVQGRQYGQGQPSPACRARRSVHRSRTRMYQQTFTIV